MLTKDQRGALVSRLLERWRGFASYSRAAHMRDLAAGQIESPERACAGAQGNLLQNVIGDVEEMLRGVDPTEDRARLLSQQEVAYAMLYHAVNAHLLARKVPMRERANAMTAAHFALVYAFDAATREAPIASIEAALAGEHVE